MIQFHSDFCQNMRTEVLQYFENMAMHFILHNRSFAPSQFHSKIICFYAFFLYKLNPLRLAKWYTVCKSNGKDNKFENNFLIICR
jgi:hypothetical protein